KGALLFGDFLLGKQEKVTRPPWMVGKTSRDAGRSSRRKPRTPQATIRTPCTTQRCGTNTHGCKSAFAKQAARLACDPSPRQQAKVPHDGEGAAVGGGAGGGLPCEVRERGPRVATMHGTRDYASGVSRA